MSATPIDLSDVKGPETEASTDIRAAVREHYATQVRSQSSCCGPECCATGSDNAAKLYSADELALVPAESATVAYGCGNPTAIAALKPGEYVLDLGSGGGIDCFLAAQRVGPTGFVYGVDMTDEMLELARRNQARQGITNVEFRKGYIEEIPLDDQSVDVIISNCVVNLSPDKAGTLTEALRVLKPGGRIAISDIVIDGDLDDLPVSEAEVRAALSWAGCIAGALTVKELERVLAQVGFEEIAVVPDAHDAREVQGDGVYMSENFSAEVAEILASRFVNASIHARRPS